MKRSFRKRVYLGGKMNIGSLLNLSTKMLNSKKYRYSKIRFSTYIRKGIK